MQFSRRKGASLYQANQKRTRANPLRQQELAAYQRLLITGGIVFLLAVFLYFYGISLIAMIGSFWGKLGNSSTQSVPYPAPTPFLGPPRLDPLPDALHKSQELIVSGWTAAGYDVLILVDGQVQKQLLADASGRFEAKNFELPEGTYQISAQVKNKTGAESAPSEPQTVVIDTTPPKLTINKPQSGQKISAEEGSWVTIEGISESGVKILINNRLVQVTSEGEFEHRFQLNPGENSLEVVATDAAGNQSKQELTVFFEAVEPSPTP